jgi:hypothetical protein
MKRETVSVRDILRNLQIFRLIGREGERSRRTQFDGRDAQQSPQRQQQPECAGDAHRLYFFSS